MSEAGRNRTTSPSSLVVKEEPCDVDTVMIKWEMSEERLGESQETRSSQCQDEEGPNIQSNVTIIHEYSHMTGIRWFMYLLLFVQIVSDLSFKLHR